MDVRRQIADSRRVRSQRSLRPRLDVLETRSLLSVTFTGNVAHDFPSDGKGVAVAADNPLVMHPMITQSLKEIVKVSGFDISGIRLLYTPEDDTLSIGIEQPSNQTSGQPVIAGDADNNGDSGSVSPAVIAITPGFQDIEGLGHSESLGVFLDLKGTGYADVVAGFSDGDPRMVKQFQVAQAVVDTSLPPFTPQFGTELPQFEGNVYLDNSPDHPNLEFSITQFSKLYQSITGKALIPFATIGVGGFGRSAEDTGIGEAYFPLQTVSLDYEIPKPPATETGTATETGMETETGTDLAPIKEPGATASDALVVDRATFGSVHAAAIESPDDVDVYAIPLRRGERLIVRVTDAWNQTGRTGGLRASIRIFNQRKRLNIGRIHANRGATFTVSMPRGASVKGIYYVGVSAAGNDRYRLNGSNRIAARGTSNQGTYQISFAIVPARSRSSRVVFLSRGA